MTLLLHCFVIGLDSRVFIWAFYFLVLFFIPEVILLWYGFISRDIIFLIFARNLERAIAVGALVCISGIDPSVLLLCCLFGVGTFAPLIFCNIGTLECLSLLLCQRCPFALYSLLVEDAVLDNALFFAIREQFVRASVRSVRFQDAPDCGVVLVDAVRDVLQGLTVHNRFVDYVDSFLVAEDARILIVNICFAISLRIQFSIYIWFVFLNFFALDGYVCQASLLLKWKLIWEFRHDSR